MAMIPEEEIERLKRDVEIAAVVRTRGVELKGSERGNLVGRCPFHEDEHPSLVVTPGKGLFRCMSPACGATGNVIQFVQRFDGVSFRHAFELLKTGTIAALAGAGAPRKRATVPKLDCPLAADANDQAALRQVIDYYHARLRENPAALDYLRKRGLALDEAIAAFRIGFVDRTLGLRLPQKNRAEGAAIRERLQRLGVLRATGHEHLRGRIVFPIPAAAPGSPSVVPPSGTKDGPDAFTHIGTIYGRAIDEHGKHDRHLFLPGPQRGLWNPAALKSPEVILCEGILDALTFWCAGYRNVTTCLSAKRLPDELLEAFIAARVQRLLLAFDRDASGDEGAAAVAAQLAARGIESARVLFPHGHDANSYALAVTPPDKSLGVLLNAAVPLDGTEKGKVSSRLAPAPSSLAASAAKVAVERAPVESEAALASEALAKAAKEEKPPVCAALQQRGEHWFFELDSREYRVGGVEKTLGSDTLKVTLRLRVGDRFHLDALDLARDAERRRFIERAAEETGLHADRLKRDLGRLLLALEQTQACLSAEASAKAEAGAPSQVELTPEEREEALALLRDPKLLERIVADFAACGLVGEKTNTLAGYLAAVSRLLDRPLAVIVRATSAAGKSSLMDAILAMMPPERRVKYSALTGQALYYLGEADLRHKILAIVEEEGAEKASYALKLLQSEGELSIASTGKDPHTGRMVTQEYRVEGPVMIFLTTTAVDLDEELLNRCLVLTVDESREQTAAIHAAQRRAETLAGLRVDQRRAAVLARHRNAQRLLRPLKVVNPYGEQLTFLDDRTRTRRDHKKYLTLIRAIALLHQHQRPVRTMSEQGRSVDYIEATLDDIAAANALAHDILGRCLDDMPPQTRRLLGLIQQMETERSAESPGRDGGLWKRRDLRAFCGWSDTALKVHLARLVELEYVAAQRDPAHLQGHLYELMFDGDVAAHQPHLSGLLDIEQLCAACDYDRNRSGRNGNRSRSGQPLVSPRSGGGQGGRTAVNAPATNGLHDAHAHSRENARPRGAVAAGRTYA